MVQEGSEIYRFTSIGLTLVDTLDDMVNEQRIEPQLAMKVVARFDRAVAEVLADKVKARLTFKVSHFPFKLPSAFLFPFSASFAPATACSSGFLFPFCFDKRGFKQTQQATKWKSPS
jgi:hypothetical protein